MAVDLQAMAPLPGVTQIQGDITKVLLMTKSSNSTLYPPMFVNGIRQLNNFNKKTRKLN